eukprot:2422431-Ditylum_brightwellii.AAC.1
MVGQPSCGTKARNYWDSHKLSRPRLAMRLCAANLGQDDRGAQESGPTDSLSRKPRPGQLIPSSRPHDTLRTK